MNLWPSPLWRFMRWVAGIKPIPVVMSREWVTDMDDVLLDLDPSSFQAIIKTLWLEDEMMPRLNVTYWDGEWAWVD